MSDDESIETIGIDGIQGSIEYLKKSEKEMHTISEDIFSSDTESISFSNDIEETLLREDIDENLDKELKRKAEKKASDQKRREQIKLDPKRNAEEKAKQKARNQKFEQQIKSDSKRYAEKKAKNNARQKAYREQIKLDSIRNAEEKAKQKARSQKRKRAKKTSALPQDSSAFLLAQNSDNKIQNRPSNSTTITNPNRPLKRLKNGLS